MIRLFRTASAFDPPGSLGCRFFDEHQILPRTGDHSDYRTQALTLRRRHECLPRLARLDRVGLLGERQRIASGELRRIAVVPFAFRIAAFRYFDLRHFVTAFDDKDQPA